MYNAHFRESVPVNEHPGDFILMDPHPAIIFAGPPPNPERLKTMYGGFAVPYEYIPSKKEHDFNYDAMYRTLAKIAHCHAVAKIGLANFDPVLTPIILGKDKNYNFLIGGQIKNWSVAIIEGALPYSLRTIIRHKDNIRWVIIIIDLLPQLRTPTYHAVAGRLQPSFKAPDQMDETYSIFNPKS